MPVIASATIPINVKEDHTIELLFLDEVNRCGCVNTQSLPRHLNVPLDELKSTIKRLVGEEAIECDIEHSICCIDKEHFTNFVKKMKALK